jgi:YVTN family beta-propeller protein
LSRPRRENVLFQLFRGRVVHRIRVGGARWDVVAGTGAVWVSNSNDGTVERIDPRTSRVVATIRTGGHPANMRFAAESLWVDSNVGTRVFRIDPETNESTAIDVGHGAPLVLRGHGHGGVGVQPDRRRRRAHRPADETRRGDDPRRKAAGRGRDRAGRTCLVP